MDEKSQLHEIVNDTSSGSTDLAMKVVDFYSSLSPGSKITAKEAYRSIKNAHIGMGIVRNANSLLYSHWKNDPGNISIAASDLKSSIESQFMKCVEVSTGLISDGEVIATISKSTAVKEVMLRSSRKIKSVYVMESRPGCEGVLLAEELQRHGIDTTVVTDASLKLISDRCSMALCGSDSVLSDYSLVHKNGTYPLFLSMKYNGKNTYSITMSIKFELEYNIGSYPEFRQHETSELTDRHVKVSNRYYDITPGSLITAYATDGGLISPGL